MKTKLRALVGGVALLLVLAACYPGASSQLLQGYDLQVNVTKGKINLNNSLWNEAPSSNGWIDPHGLQGPWNFPRSNDSNQAQFDLSFSQTQGNWNVKGKWIDGSVKMEFTGRSEYLAALTAHCLSNIYTGAGFQQINYWELDGDSYGYDYEAEDCGDFWEFAPGYTSLSYNKFLKGGCAYIPTLYRSLNSNYVGTGHALLLVCQNGNGSNPITGDWDNPSYVEVWIPDTTWISEQRIGDVDIYHVGDNNFDVENNWNPEDLYDLRIGFEDNVFYGVNYFVDDNSPFRNYYAGGINTNRSGKWVVQVRLNQLAMTDMPTESPLFSVDWYGLP